MTGLNCALLIAWLTWGTAAQRAKPSAPCPSDAVCCPARSAGFYLQGDDYQGPPPAVVRRVPPDMKDVTRPYPSGAAILEIAIDTEGHVVSACVLRGLRPDFDRAAQAAARQWRFKPTVVGSTPVGVRLTVSISPKSRDLGRRS